VLLPPHPAISQPTNTVTYAYCKQQTTQRYANRKVIERRVDLAI
jgi:hypothetical protein